MKVVTVKYTGFKLIGHDTMRDYDKNQPISATCDVPVTEEIFNIVDADDNSDSDDWAWDMLECAVDSLAACSGIYMKSIESIEV